MKKYYGLLLMIAVGIILSACGTSESAIQTAIAQTEAANPTETKTPKPTNTPTFTITPTNTPKPPPIEERIIGKWSGVMTNKNGDKIPAFWTFLDGGVMVIELNPFGFSYGAEWHVEGSRIHIIPETDPNDQTYRDVEFVTDDVMILTKEEADIRETWTRVEDK
jgi:hypothetical protein